MKTFHDKVAAITGAGSGIGRALALNLARQGCELALSDVNEQGLAETVELLRRFEVKVSHRRVDVADFEAMRQWADQVMIDHGRVNLVINNAGVALAGTVESNALDDYHWIMNINFWGVVHGSKAFLPYLKACGAGHIVNVSSLFGLFAQPGMSGYNASKYAVRGFTESLRQELDIADCGVSASCVHPGGIRTNIARSARMNDSLVQVTGHSADQSRQQFNDLLLRTSTEKAAEVILRGVQRNRRRILIGLDARGVDLMTRSMPAFYQRMVVLTMRLAARFAPRTPEKTPEVAE